MTTFSSSGIYCQFLNGLPYKFFEHYREYHARLEDYGKIPNTGAADLAFRGEFKQWKSTFTINYIFL